MVVEVGGCAWRSERARYSSHGLQRAGGPLGAGGKNPLCVQHTDADAAAAPRGPDHARRQAEGSLMQSEP